MKPAAVPWASLGWLAVVLVIALAAPLLAPIGPHAIAAAPLTQPDARTWLGTDQLGRDLWARLVFGSRLSLGMSLAAASVATVLGGALGLAAATRGGLLEQVLMGAANTALAIPGLLLTLLLISILGPGLPTLTLAVGLGGVPGFARLARAAFRVPRSQGFVSAARSLGAGSTWIAVRHLVPNARADLAALATTYYAWLFVAATSLTFLGFGGDPSTPEWGAMLQAGRAHLFDAPRLSLAPGLAITLTVLSVHALGSWLAGGPDNGGSMF